VLLLSLSCRCLRPHPFRSFSPPPLPFVFSLLQHPLCLLSRRHLQLIHTVHTDCITAQPLFQYAEQLDRKGGLPTLFLLPFLLSLFSLSLFFTPHSKASTAPPASEHGSLQVKPTSRLHAHQYHFSSKLVLFAYASPPLHHLAQGNEVAHVVEPAFPRFCLRIAVF